MAHPMMGMIPQMGRMGMSPQMGFSLDSLLDNIGSSLQQGLDKAKNQAIATTLQSVAKDPTVQQAIVESGNDAAIANLAQQLKNAQVTTVTYVKKNPYTTAFILGGVVIGGFLLFKLMRK